eukprot:1190521-Prorocentrum_minimum.AAC.1
MYWHNLFAGAGEGKGAVRRGDGGGQEDGGGGGEVHGGARDPLQKGRRRRPGDGAAHHPHADRAGLLQGENASPVAGPVPRLS